MHDYDAAAGGSAAVDAGAIRAAIGVSGIGNGIPVGTVVRCAGAATAAHHDCTCGGREGHATKASHDASAIPAETSGSAGATIAARASAAVLIIGGRIRVGCAATSVARCAARIAAVG